MDGRIAMRSMSCSITNYCWCDRLNEYNCQIKWTRTGERIHAQIGHRHIQVYGCTGAGWERMMNACLGCRLVFLHANLQSNMHVDLTVCCFSAFVSVCGGAEWWEMNITSLYGFLSITHAMSLCSYNFIRQCYDISVLSSVIANNTISVHFFFYSCRLFGSEFVFLIDIMRSHILHTNDSDVVSFKSMSIQRACTELEVMKCSSYSGSIQCRMEEDEEVRNMNIKNRFSW